MVTLAVTTFDRFARLLPRLQALLDEVGSAAGKGQAAAMTAYAAGYNGASSTIKAVVDGDLTPEMVDAFSGLGFTDPQDVDQKRVDIVNSAVSSWDVAAAALVHGDAPKAEELTAALEARMHEFDDAVTTLGELAVSPDR